MNEIMKVEQLPRLLEQFEAAGCEIDARLDPLRSLVCTEESFQRIKQIRAQMRKEFDEFENQKKEIKSKVFAPWEAFESSYKLNIADKYKRADAELKAGIDMVSNELKDKKRNEVKDYFDEYAKSLGIDFVTYDRAGIDVTLSSSLKSLKAEAKGFLDKISEDVRMIRMQEAKDEIFIEYKESLNAIAALEAVTVRHRKIQEEQEKNIPQQEVKEAEKPPLSAPIEQEPVLTVSFRVTAEKSKLKRLKQFLNDGGYQYE